MALAKRWTRGWLLGIGVAHGQAGLVLAGLLFHAGTFFCQLDHERATTPAHPIRDCSKTGLGLAPACMYRILCIIRS